jgi:N-acetylmuramoyl-L-alanine amidase
MVLAAAAPASKTPPPERGEAQPVGALTGATIFVSAGHGWYHSNGGWTTQRGPINRIVEDLSNAEAVNQFLLPYLWNAGANVVTTRERDMQTQMAVVTAESGSPVTQGAWKREDNENVWGGTQLVAPTVRGEPTARVAYVPRIPADGYYAVYAWYAPVRRGRTSTDARLTIRHSGGSTEWRQDLTRDHSTWKYLGTYHFEAGRDALRGAVVLDNSSSRAGQHVALGAVRFGGGMGDTRVAGALSGKPRWEESGLYYAPFMGMPVAEDDMRAWNQVRAMPRYAEWEAEPWEKNRSIYVSWHTNGSETHTMSGLSTYIYGPNAWGPPWDFTGYPGGDVLGRIVHNEVLHHVRTAYDARWEDVGLIARWLGETNPAANAKMPAVLIENGFHDNPADAGHILDPHFRHISARAVYHGILKYFHQEVDGFDIATRLPEPPTHLRVRKTGMNRIEVAWNPPPFDKGDGVLGDAATSYRVYRSRNGYGFDNGTVVEETRTVLEGVLPGQVEYFRVVAVNEGGESLPTETLAVRAPERTLQPEVLVVNGFDRLDRGLNLVDSTTFPGHEFERTIVSKMNTFNYVVQHGSALHAAGWHFDSTSNEAVVAGDVRLRDYRIVVWILGNEGEGSTFDGFERRLVREYLESGGNLFVSGSNLASDLGFASRDLAGDFLREMLKVECVRPAARINQATNARDGLLLRLDTLAFDDGTGRTYPVTTADVLRPMGGAQAILTYPNGAPGEAAAIRYAGPWRLVYLAFPFETILDETHRTEIMARSMAFLNGELTF